MTRFYRFQLVFLLTLFVPALTAVCPAQTAFTFYENRSITPLSVRSVPASAVREIIPLAGVWTAKLPNNTTREIYIPSALDFAGKVSFERTVKLPKELEYKHFSLVCEGAANTCTILINDQVIATHSASGTVFKADIINEVLKFGGDNKLTVITDTQLDAEKTLPIKPQAFDRKNFGGIYRNLYLVVEPEVRIDDVSMRTDVFLRDTTKKAAPRNPLPRAAAQVTDSLAMGKMDSLVLKLRVKIKTQTLAEFNTKLDSVRTKKVTAVLRLRPTDNDTVITFEKTLFDFEPENDKTFTEESAVTIPNLQLWSLKNPARYRVEVLLRKGLLPVDDLVYFTGFRSLALKGGKAFLNGEPLEFKGITVIEESDASASALGREDVLRDLALVKTLGANAVRFRQAPNPLWTRFCDSLGILVLCELPVDNVPSAILSKKNFIENSQAFLRDLLAYTKFNPSVVAYGFGTGIDIASGTPSEEAAAYLKPLYTIAREQTGNWVYFAPRAFVRSPCWDYSDLVGVTAPSLTPERFKETVGTAARLLTLKPALILEYGVAAEPNNNNGYSDRHSHEYQAKYVMDAYKAMRDLSRNDSSAALAGSFVAALSDFHLHRPPLAFTDYPDKYLETVGVTTFARDKKPSFQMLKSLYADEKVYNPPIGAVELAFTPALVLWSIFLTAALVFILNQRKRLRENVVRAVVRPFSLYSDVRDQRINILLEPLLLLTVLSFIWGSILAAICYSARDSQVFEFWLTHLAQNNAVKGVLNRLILTPSLAVAAFGLMFLLLSLLLAALIKLYIFVAGRSRVNYLQALNVWVWASAHWVALVFMAALIDRLESREFIVAVVALSLVFLIWSLLRLFRGLSIVCDSSRVRVHFAGWTTALVLVGVIFYLYHRNQQTLSYLEYWRGSLISASGFFTPAATKP